MMPGGRRRALTRTPLAPALAALGVLVVLLALVPASPAVATSTSTTTAKPRHHGHARVIPSEVALTPSLTSAPGVSVTMPPIGLSIEYPIMAAAMGSEACPPRALFAELLRLGSPPLELGGATQDLTAPSEALTGPPTSWEAAKLYPLPASFWGQLHCLLEATKDPLTVGLNMRTGNVGWAALMAAGAQSAATNGLGFSLANEPDLYGLPNLSSLAKPLAGAEAAAASLYLQLGAYLAPAVGGAPIVGPELARPLHWRSQLMHVVTQLHEQTVGVHLYPLSGCSSPRAVTVPGLLSAGVGAAPARLQWVVSEAQAARLPAIISEANSASCGGLAGVSDTPAAAVWAVRFVLSALKTGFREVRFHLAGDPYDPFVVHGSTLAARPIEYALAALTQWLPLGASVRTVGGVRELLATAVKQPNGAAVLVLDNERTKTRPVVLRGARTVHVEVLSSTRAGVHSLTLSATHGAIKLPIAASSVVAISATA
jgi:hypothetical protein